MPAAVRKLMSLLLAAAAALGGLFNLLFEVPGAADPRPVVCGTFLQPWAFADFSRERIGLHFDGLLEAGIDTVIIQWTAVTPDGKIETSYYPAGAPSSWPDFTENCLACAQERGMKVFLGLNIADEWWSNFGSDRAWMLAQARLGNEIAGRLYGFYKNKYPAAMAGWYFAWEFSNALSPYELRCAEMLNVTLDYLSVLDASMPLMLSPFLTSAVSPAQTCASWSAVFANTRFREGDIFCCQDSVGAGHIGMGDLDRYFAAMKAAADTKPQLAFWANNENFTAADWSSAPLSRFVEQMKITSKYVENHVTFAYSHYYAADMGKAQYHEAYLRYRLTGET